MSPNDSWKAAAPTAPASKRSGRSEWRLVIARIVLPAKDLRDRCVARRHAQSTAMADSDIVPVVQKDRFEVSGDRRVVDNEPGVAVLQHARTRPILAADDHPLMV